MMAYRSYDADLIKGIVCDPEVFRTVSDDGMSSGDFTPEVNDECWLITEAESTPVAAYNFHALNSITLQMHVHVLPLFRLSHAREATKAALSWIVSNSPAGFAKVVIFIPSVYPKVVNFAKKFGFKVEGINTNSDMVGGAICDRVMIGSTFTEISEWLRNES